LSKEQRRFFRINDTLGVFCRPLSPKESAAVSAETALNTANAHSLMATCDREISKSLMELRRHDKVTANLIDAVIRKLDYALHMFTVEQNALKEIRHKLQEVNISACGLAFIRDRPLSPDSWVSLNLELKPSNQEIVTYGIVVGCETCPGGFYVRINFEQMAEEDQEALILHLMQRQRVQRREA
jgi:hypothetical protein